MKSMKNNAICNINVICIIKNNVICTIMDEFTIMNIIFCLNLSMKKSKNWLIKNK